MGSWLSFSVCALGSRYTLNGTRAASCRTCSDLMSTLFGSEPCRASGQEGTDSGSRVWLSLVSARGLSATT